ncbi:MAG: hypothetical protein EZS28_049292, partial [Streblomastix strix]
MAGSMTVSMIRFWGCQPNHPEPDLSTQPRKNDPKQKKLENTSLRFRNYLIIIQ